MPLLSNEEIAGKLSAFKGWEIEENLIKKTFKKRIL